MSAGGEHDGELRLAPESIEALAIRLAELIQPRDPPRQRERISAAEVARLWGVHRRWVYEHADELGARRLGGGRRPRLRFDPDEVAERLGEPASADAPGGGGRRSARMRGDCRTDSISSPDRASVGEQARKRPGGRANAPRPGADVGGAMKRVSRAEPSSCPNCPPPEGQEAGDEH